MPTRRWHASLAKRDEKEIKARFDIKVKEAKRTAARQAKKTMRDVPGVGPNHLAVVDAAGEFELVHLAPAAAKTGSSQDLTA